MTNTQMADPDRALLLAFIADAQDSLAEGRPANFWPRNHHRLRPIEKRAKDLLSPAEHADYLFHRFCRTGGFPVMAERDLPLLIPVWRRILPHLDGAPARSISRHMMLYLFGFDDSGALPDELPPTGKDLKARLKLIDQITAYTTQPAQRAKQARFATFASEAPRILRALRHLGYNHDRRHGGEIYDVTNLSFWGMVFVVLLNPATRAELLDDMLGDTYRLVQREDQLSMLDAYVKAVAPDASPDETRFLELAARLADLERARRAATEAGALAQRLDLPFEADQDWAIHIRLALRSLPSGPAANGDAVVLNISANTDRPWDLFVELGWKRPFSERARGVIRNDLNLPSLGAGNLHRFPQWLARLRAEHGFDADLAAAKIQVGRKRAAVKPIAAWLADKPIAAWLADRPIAS